MIYGGLPGIWLGERLGFGKALGALYGAFLASGLYHELASYAMGKGLDWQVPAFFLLHATLMLGERVWRYVTGRRVGGWLGAVWVYFAIIVLGQNMGMCIVPKFLKNIINMHYYSRFLAPKRARRWPCHPSSDKSNTTNTISHVCNLSNYYNSFPVWDSGWDLGI
jgi:hypothetical protein